MCLCHCPPSTADPEDGSSAQRCDAVPRPPGARPGGPGHCPPRGPRTPVHTARRPVTVCDAVSSPGDRDSLQTPTLELRIGPGAVLGSPLSCVDGVGWRGGGQAFGEIFISWFSRWNISWCLGASNRDIRAELKRQISGKGSLCALEMQDFTMSNRHA